MIKLKFISANETWADFGQIFQISEIQRFSDFRETHPENFRTIFPVSEVLEFLPDESVHYNTFQP